MQDSESSIYHVNNNQNLQVRSVEAALISLERAQKLDLLIHLISNLRQSLVICGPRGIGKTMVLNELRTSKKDAWYIDTIEGSTSLSFESFQSQLSRLVTTSFAEYKNQDLSSMLSVLDKQHQKIVIIIDDAGQLVPGLIATLIQYAAASACLRIVFSLTNDELHVKNSTDRAIDECHFIEIPPLSEKQCGVFLQNLSALPGAIISFNAINDYLVEKLYRETHGIPGKIIAELPKLAHYRVVDSYKLGGGALLLILVLGAVGISWLISDDSDLNIERDKITTPVVMKKPEVVEISSPVVNSAKHDQITNIPKVFLDKSTDVLNSPVTKTNATIPLLVGNAETDGLGNDSQPQQLEQQELQEPVANKVIEIDNETIKIVEKKSGAVAEPVKIEQVLLKSVPVKKAPFKQIPVVKKVIKPPPVVDKLKTLEVKKAIKEVKTVVKKTPTKLNSTEALDDRQWVLKQAEKNYTIQLMVLSKREAVVEFLKKNKSIKENIKYFQLSKQGKQSYVVIYGSFKNKVIASKKIKSLPIKYRKSWVRRFRSLQKKINN